MKFDDDSGYWVDSSGCRYVRNEFDPANPTYIRVTPKQWNGTRLNQQHRLEWPPYIEPSLKMDLENILKIQMRRYSPSSLVNFKQAIWAIARVQVKSHRTITADLADADVVRAIWEQAKPSNRAWIRILIRELQGLLDQKHALAVSLMTKKLKENRGSAWKKAVLEWDPNHGSLISSELELLRKHLEPPTEEPLACHFARVFTRLTEVTLKRPSQLVTIRADALRSTTTHIGTSVDIRIPLVKGQSGQAPRWNPIPKGLAEDIEAYRNRAPIKDSDAARDCLLPMVSFLGSENERVFAPYGAQAKGAVQAWIRRLGIVSPRTGKPLRLTLRRIRHTGATHLALQGYSLELIQDILEQEWVGSARHYIDAVGVLYLPAFERADRNLGGRFSMMREAWFKGTVVDQRETPDRPIVVPDASAPAIVGACGKQDTCPVHPLFSCYSCEYFLAFREANHQRVLDYVDAEYQRWRAVEVSSSRSKAIKDFDRVAAGVREVLEMINRERSNGPI